LPERFTFFLSRENQIISFGQRFIETRPRFFVTPQTIEDRTTIIKTQSFALSCLVSRSLAKRLDRLFRVTRKKFQPGQVRQSLTIYKQANIRSGLEMFFAGGDVFSISRTKP